MGNSPPAAVIACGSEARRIYLDAIEAALAEPGRKGASLPRNTIEDVLVRQIGQIEKIRKLHDKHMRRRLRDDEEWAPDPEFVAAVAKNTDAIGKAITVLERARKSAKDARRGLTDEELDKVFKHNLKRLAQKMPAEDWRVLISIGFGTEVADVLLKGRE